MLCTFFSVTLFTPGFANGWNESIAFENIADESLSGIDYERTPSTPLALGVETHGAIWDDIAFFVPIFAPTPDGNLVWTGIEFDNGTMTVEINQGNANRFLAVELLGTVGIVPGATVNRNGIGGVVKVTPRRGTATLVPIQGGSSFGSQHALEALFGLGSARKATVEIFWPGGHRNRLYNVSADQQILFPEIPCSFDDNSISRSEYRSCVRDALNALLAEGIITRREWRQFYRSALRAYRESKRKSKY